MAFEPEGIRCQPGNYSYYLENRLQRKASRNVAGTSDKTEKPSMPETKIKRSRPRKLGYMEERELEGMEANIQQAEEGIQSLKTHSTTLSFTMSELISSGHDRVLESRRQEVTALYHRWEELLAIKEASEQGKGGRDNFIGGNLAMGLVSLWRSSQPKIRMQEVVGTTM